MYMLYRYECVGVLKHILDWLVALGGSRIDTYIYIWWLVEMSFPRSVQNL